MAISLRLLLLTGVVAGFMGHWWGRDAAWAFVLARTGIRLNESVDLRRSDLDLAGGRLRIDQGQGRKDPSAYLSETTQRVLTRYLAALPALLR
jgi:integrase